MFELREVTPEDKISYENYIREWQRHDEDITPTAMDPSVNNFETLLAQLKEDKHPKEDGRVPATMLFYFKGNEIVGAAHIRHELNDHLKLIGGHVGYGVSPHSRGNGYATKILESSLLFLKSLDVKKVLITCDEDNLPSAKVILNNNGIECDPHTRSNGIVTRRFWITLQY